LHARRAGNGTEVKETRLSAFRFLYVPEASLKESFVARMERSEIRDRHLEALRSSPDSQALHPAVGF
jgi:hypothetical protein